MSAHLMPKDATATEAPLHFVDPRAFKARTREAVDDAHLRRSFRSATDFLQAKRAAHFGDAAGFDALRHVARPSANTACPGCRTCWSAWSNA